MKSYTSSPPTACMAYSGTALLFFGCDVEDPIRLAHDRVQRWALLKRLIDLSVP
jgi:hypothetical protein